MHLTEFAALLVFLALLATVRLVFVRRAQDPFGLFLLGFALFYGFRAVLVATGLDAPSPSYLFVTSNLEGVLTKTVLGLCLFLVAFICAASLVTRRAASSPGFLFHTQPINITRIVFVTVTLTFLALVIHGYLLSRFGSFGGIVHAAKISKSLAGSFVLKLPSEIGALIGTAAYLEIRHRFAARALRLVMLGCAVLDAVLVFAWGQRGVLVIIVAMLVLVPERSIGPRPKGLGINGFTRIALAAVLVLSLAVFLRSTRDTYTQPGETSSFAEGNIFRKASQGINGTYFDAAMLAFRDWPAEHQFRNGTDYWDGVISTVPRKILPDKPASSSVEFRQVYEPQTVNGWPVGSPAAWYLNFGWLGLVLGGLISGGVIGAIARRYAVAPWSGGNTALAFTLGVFVLRLGVGSQSLHALEVTFIPIALIMRFLVSKKTVDEGRRLLNDGTEPPSAPAATGGRVGTRTEVVPELARRDPWTFRDGLRPPDSSRDLAM